MAENITLNAAIVARTRIAQEAQRTARADLTKRDNARALADVNARNRIRQEDLKIQDARFEDATVDLARQRGNQRATRDNQLIGDVVATDARLRQTQNDLTAELNLAEARQADVENTILQQQDNQVLDASGNVLPPTTEQDNTGDFDAFLQARDLRLSDVQQQNRDRDVQSQIDTRLAIDRIQSPDTAAVLTDGGQALPTGSSDLGSEPAPRGVLVDIIS